MEGTKTITISYKQECSKVFIINPSIFEDFYNLATYYGGLEIMDHQFVFKSMINFNMIDLYLTSNPKSKFLKGSIVRNLNTITA